MAEYTPITQDEMEQFLSEHGGGYQPVRLPGVRELVYAARVDRDGLDLLQVIYTGIEPDGASRGSGEDAIRCVLFHRRDQATVKKIATSTRVHRVKGWRANLTERLASLVPGPSCPDCGSPMVERKSKRGPFYGCSDFPTCRATRAKEA